MRFRRQADSTTRRTRRWRVPALLAASVLTGTAITVGVATAPNALAADTQATITLSGITSNTYPVGGNTVWVQPGTALTISQAPINVAGNQGLLGTVSGLVKGLLGGLLQPQVVGLKATVDLSSVQRGTQTLASGQSVTTPALAKGVYPIAWSFTAITAAGQSVDLNGNQLNPLGIKLNAKNQYIGFIVSDTQSPCGGAQCIALQTPTLSVAPSVPVVGQLPTVTVPGQNVNIPVPSIPGVNAPVTGSSSSAPNSSAPTSTAPGSTSTGIVNPYQYGAGSCAGPCAVVPRGGGNGGRVGAASGVTLGDLGDAAAGSATSNSSASGGSGNDSALVGNADNGAGTQLAVDRAFTSGGATGATAGPGVSTGLALAAVAALAGASVLWFARRRLARG